VTLPTIRSFVPGGRPPPRPNAAYVAALFQGSLRDRQVFTEVPVACITALVAISVPFKWCGFCTRAHPPPLLHLDCPCLSLRNCVWYDLTSIFFLLILLVGCQEESDSSSFSPLRHFLYPLFSALSVGPPDDPYLP